jgi:hypothetical protein
MHLLQTLGSHYQRLKVHRYIGGSPHSDFALPEVSCPALQGCMVGVRNTIDEATSLILDVPGTCRGRQWMKIARAVCKGNSIGLVSEFSEPHVAHL